MNNAEGFKGIIEQKLLSLHTAYIGKVLKYSNGKADIQPLMMIKQYGKPAEAHSPIPNVPVTEQARIKTETKTVELVTGVKLELTRSNGYVTNVTPTITKSTITYTEPKSIGVGDIVVCVCGERDITEAKNGNMAQQPIGHHSLSDSMVVGIL